MEVLALADGALSIPMLKNSFAMVDSREIRRVPRFAEISGPALERLCRNATKRKLRRGESVFWEGDPGNHFHMVLDGEVRIFKVLESGREIILGFFYPGDAVGEVAILDGEPYPASAQAHVPTTILTLPAGEYLELLEQHPEIARSIIRDLTLRLRAMRVRVETLSESGMQSRIALLLQSFAREKGSKQEGGVLVPVKLSRAEIAGMVGARIETVIRIMSRWQKEGIVSTHKQGFLIKDASMLHGLAVADN